MGLFVAKVCVKHQSIMDLVPYKNRHHQCVYQNLFNKIELKVFVVAMPKFR